MVDNDTAVLWTWERMMQKTELYCEYRDFYSEQFQMQISGWWMSRLALDDVIMYEWPQ
jgi:hypothetical protein